MSLDYRDFNMAANSAIEEMLADSVFNQPDNHRVILMIGFVANRTMQKIDTDSVIKKIRVALNRSGKAAVSTVIAHGGPESAAASINSSMRDNEDFNQLTIAKKGKFEAPEYELTGKFLQRNVRAGKNHTQAEYYFQLSLTNLTSGVAMFESERRIIKRGTNKTVVW